MAKKRRRIGKLALQEYIAGYVFALPWFIGFIAFVAGPLIYSLWLSLTRYEVLTPPTFIGLSNYRDLLSDELFWKSLSNTLYMVIVGVPAEILIALAIALLLNNDVKGIAWYRAIYYLPAIVPVVASSVLWMWIFNANYGFLNTVLGSLGLGKPNWLMDPRLSKVAIIIMNTWAAGANMIIFLAGLKGIPEQLYEAARIDGANWWQCFWKITLPLLSPTTFFMVIMGIIGAFQIFTQAYIMTEGGPLDSTLFYVYYLFNNAFAYFKMGYASAMAWILFIIILIITLLQWRLAPRWVHYE